MPEKFFKNSIFNSKFKKTLDFNHEKPLITIFEIIMNNLTNHAVIISVSFYNLCCDLSKYLYIYEHILRKTP